jgi:hypothetical protein
MFHIREIKTASGANAVQVVYYRYRKRVVFKHIGSTKSATELESLRLVAQEVISSSTSQASLFDDITFDNLLYLKKSEFLGVYHTFLYEVLCNLIEQIGFDKIKKQLLLDLVAIRMTEPESKLRSIELLETYFGIRHRRQNYYLSAP